MTPDLHVLIREEMSAEHKIVQTGCSTCQKHFGTVEQFKRHLSEDVLVRLLVSVRSVDFGDCLYRASLRIPRSLGVHPVW